jgi:hypothetical protein
MAFPTEASGRGLTGRINPHDSDAPSCYVIQRASASSDLIGHIDSQHTKADFADFADQSCA